MSFLGPSKNMRFPEGKGPSKDMRFLGPSKDMRFQEGKQTMGIKAHEIESPSKDMRFFTLGSAITVPWLPLDGGAGAKPLLGSANTVQCQVRLGSGKVKLRLDMVRLELG